MQPLTEAIELSDKLKDIPFVSQPTSRVMVIFSSPKIEFQSAKCRLVLFLCLLTSSPCFIDGFHLERTQNVAIMYPMQDEKRVSTRFPLDVLEALRQRAKEDGRSINSEVIWGLREYIRQRERERHISQQDVQK
jgi:hypothetical protein